MGKHHEHDLQEESTAWQLSGLFDHAISFEFSKFVTRFLQQLLHDISASSVEIMCSRKLDPGSCLSSPWFKAQRDMLEGEISFRYGRTLRWLGVDQPAYFSDIKKFISWEGASYGPFLAGLQDMAIGAGNVSGNVWVTPFESSTELAAKRRALLEMVLLAVAFMRANLANTPYDSKQLAIANVGFNAGHSAAMVLWTFPSVSVYSFDLCEHPHTQMASALLQQHFGNRHALICGDSWNTLPAFALDPSRPQHIAAVFIDGDHTYYGARRDMESASRLGSDEVPVVLIADDCYSPMNLSIPRRKPIELSVSLAWRHAVGVADTSMESPAGLCLGTSIRDEHRKSLAVASVSDSVRFQHCLADIGERGLSYWLNTYFLGRCA